MSAEISNDAFKASMIAQIKEIQEMLNELKIIKRGSEKKSIKRKTAKRGTISKRKTVKRKTAKRRTVSKRKTVKEKTAKRKTVKEKTAKRRTISKRKTSRRR